jgi:hypothetical protein
MNDQLLEELLNDDEGSALDFKRDQYAFVGATDDQKAELLKDILSFANAWRRTDAYILMGVDEVRGGRSTVVGLTNHLSDSELQQFVNGKTQRPVDFSYQAYPFEGKQIGIIRIARQERPTVLKKNYAWLQKGVVYFRRGSSTAEADAVEIARMGRADHVERSTPVLDLQFADPEKRTAVGIGVAIQSTVVKVQGRLPNYSNGIPFGSGLTIRTRSSIDDNENYWRDLAAYVVDTALVKPVWLVLTNQSSTTAIDVRVQITCGDAELVSVMDASEYPHKPSTSSLGAIVARRVGPPPAAIVHRHGSSWTITIDVGKIQPKEVWWMREPICIGAENPITARLAAKVFADNLPEPLSFSLTVDVEVESRDMEFADLQDIAENDS